jgi:hypothetical protein
MGVIVSGNASFCQSSNRCNHRIILECFINRQGYRCITSWYEWIISVLGMEAKAIDLVNGNRPQNKASDVPDRPFMVNVYPVCNYPALCVGSPEGIAFQEPWKPGMASGSSMDGFMRFLKCDTFWAFFGESLPRFYPSRS